jgi:hypothetical protein
MRRQPETVGAASVRLEGQSADPPRMVSAEKSSDVPATAEQGVHFHRRLL